MARLPHNFHSVWVSLQTCWLTDLHIEGVPGGWYIAFDLFAFDSQCIDEHFV
jgi:hypothetical protein